MIILEKYLLLSKETQEYSNNKDSADAKKMDVDHIMLKNAFKEKEETNGKNK